MILYNINILFITSKKEVYYLIVNPKPLSGWNIYLINATTGMEIANTTTGVSGFFKFTGLSPGVYTVSEERRGGWVNVTPLSQIVTISRSDITNLDFINLNLITTFNISGFKLNDSNSTGIPGWIIRLLNTTTGLEIANQTTDNSGFYNFSGLSNGTYNVTEVMKAGWTNTSPASVPITINGQDILNVNFTNQPVMQPVGGVVYRQNGISAYADWIENTSIDKMSDTFLSVTQSDVGTDIYLSICTSTFVGYSCKSGDKLTQDNVLSMDKRLDSASLKSVQIKLYQWKCVNDVCSSTPAGTATVEATWTGTGKVSKDRYKWMSGNGDYIEKGSSGSLSRMATAEGTMNKQKLGKGNFGGLAKFKSVNIEMIK
jgi:hypothetical protein